MIRVKGRFLPRRRIRPAEEFNYSLLISGFSNGQLERGSGSSIEFEVASERLDAHAPATYALEQSLLGLW